jgi:hypothetical protein
MLRAEKTSNAPLHPGPLCLRKDLEQAGIQLRDEVGRRVDFHSLRMTFGTTLLANGVHPIVVKRADASQRLQADDQPVQRFVKAAAGARRRSAAEHGEGN